MKVLFISRATLFTDKGGDTVQIVNTASGLKKLGVAVDIRINDRSINYEEYDLIHFFNIIRPADILYHVAISKKPFVISTIYVDYSEYEKKQRSGMLGLAFRLLPADFIEYAKTIARHLIGHEKIASRSYYFLGQKRAIQKVIKKAALLLPNSDSEYARLHRKYKLAQKYKVVPNAIDPDLFNNLTTTLKDENLVLCVGRIEGRKNQLTLIKALKRSGYKLILIGSPARNQPAYFSACKQEASNNVEFIENIPQAELLKYYSKAKVHVLPSWFETTGLSSLEAAVMGCNIVITDKGDAREYFGDFAYYCDPASPLSVREAIDKAAKQPFNEALRKKILEQYTWANTAKNTLDAYKEVLSIK